MNRVPRPSNLLKCGSHAAACSVLFRILAGLGLTLILCLSAPAATLEQLIAENFHVRVRIGDPRDEQVLVPTGPCLLLDRHGEIVRTVQGGERLTITCPERDAPPPEWRVVLASFSIAGKPSARALAARVAEATGAGTSMMLVPDEDEGQRIRVTLGHCESRAEANEMLHRVSEIAPKAFIWQDSDRRRVPRLAIASPGRESVERAWEEVTLAPLDDATQISARRNGDRRSYRGRLILRGTADREILLINDVHIEDYLCSVVAAEIGGEAPEAALCAQAIAARSEALHKVARMHHSSIHYDLDDTPYTMTYPGVEAETPTSRAAVAETRGLTLMFEGEICDAVYGHSCGGVTADCAEVWHAPSIPYLRTRRDTVRANPPPARIDDATVAAFLEGSPDVLCDPEGNSRFPNYAKEYFRWTARFSAENLAAQLGVDFGGITSVRVAERGPSGRVMRLVVEGPEATEELVKNTELRERLEVLRSSLFVVEEKRDANGTLLEVRFLGGGWGHGVGLCQMGARTRALNGQTYREILDAYYTDTELRRLY